MKTKHLWVLFLILVMVAPTCIITRPVAAAPEEPNWLTTQSAEAVCVNGQIVINVSFTNSEPAGNPYWYMDVLATDQQTNQSSNLGTVQGGQTVTGQIPTGLSSVGDGKVKFFLTWTNHRWGVDSRYANYYGATCPPPPPAVCRTISSDKTQLKVGETALLSVNAEGAVSYRFYLNDVVVQEGNNTTFSFTANMAGIYNFRAEVLGLNGEWNGAQKCQMQITVNPRDYRNYLPMIGKGCPTDICPVMEDVGKFGFSPDPNSTPVVWYVLRLGEPYATQPPGVSIWLSLQPQTVGYYIVDAEWRSADGSKKITLPEVYPGASVNWEFRLMSNVQPGFIHINLFYRTMVNGIWKDCWMGSYSLKVDDGGPMKTSSMQYVQ